MPYTQLYYFAFPPAMSESCFSFIPQLGFCAVRLLVFSELSVSVAWCLTIIEKFSDTVLKISPVPFISFWCYCMHMLFCVCVVLLQSIDIFLVFFCLFLIYLLTQKFFHVQSTNKQIKRVLVLFVIIFLILSIAFQFFLSIYISLNIVLCCSVLSDFL